MKTQIETALLSGQKMIVVDNIEIHLSKWRLKRDTTFRRRRQASIYADEIIELIKT